MLDNPGLDVWQKKNTCHIAEEALYGFSNRDKVLKQTSNMMQRFLDQQRKVQHLCHFNHQTGWVEIIFISWFWTNYKLC